MGSHLMWNKTHIFVDAGYLRAGNFKDIEEKG